MNIFTGGCLCGQLRLTARGQPYRVGLCHCMDCRKHHGALFHASAIFPESAVTITGEAHAYQGRAFCPTWTEEQRQLRAQWLHTCYEPAIVRSFEDFGRDDIHAARRRGA